MRGDDVKRFGDAICTGQTKSGKALIVEVLGRGGYKPHLIPKSVIHEDSQINAQGDRGTLVVARWFAEKELE